MTRAKTKYDLSDISNVIDVLHSLYKSKGIDFNKSFEEVIQSGMKCLSGFGARPAFNKLREAECGESYLAVLLYIIRAGPSWSNTWRLVVGSQRRRKQTIAIIQKAITALESLDKAFEQLIARDAGPSGRHLVDGPKPNFQTADSSTIAAPAATARSLRAYVRFLDILGNASTQAKIHSPEALGKHLLSSYVKEATGDYHDAEVSALISGALREQYSEEAHRMWRKRNWKHLDVISFPPELLIVLGFLFATQT